MPDIAAARLTAPAGHVFDQLEDDRLGGAVARILTRPDMGERDVTTRSPPASEPSAESAPDAHHREAVRSRLAEVLDLIAKR
ncbi:MULTISPECIES: hypothetical protein [unclassified Streptomyces]|uniref:hypothetical protein n=1 Tax=unclassified Streptomyces TaxID=2593676 RepID=UPI0016559E71|nr:hypothetical protein [Streptomyces sp. CB02980]MCB8901829.1 hypothetical protein [Streptomyces sp. CB02980]